MNRKPDRPRAVTACPMGERSVFSLSGRVACYLTAPALGLSQDSSPGCLQRNSCSLALGVSQDASPRCPRVYAGSGSCFFLFVFLLLFDLAGPRRVARLVSEVSPAQPLPLGHRRVARFVSEVSPGVLRWWSVLKKKEEVCCNTGLRCRLPNHAGPRRVARHVSEVSPAQHVHFGLELWLKFWRSLLLRQFHLHRPALPCPLEHHGQPRAQDPVHLRECGSRPHLHPE